MAAQEKTYETRGGAIHYWVSRAREDDPWLVFLPGLTADHHLFDRQTEYFDGRCNCLVWDAPAHGASRPFALDFSLEDVAAWLRGILSRERIVRPVLAGQSMGGYISQMYISLYPGEVSGFVSIDSCSLRRKYYTGWELWLLKRTKWMYMAFPWRLLMRCGANGTATSGYGRQLMRKTMEGYRKREYCELADHGFRILAEAVEAGRPYEISCPVLLICGEKDHAGSAKRYNVRWTKEDGLPMVWIPGAGHNSNTDAPDEVNRLIEDFTQKAAR